MQVEIRIVTDFPNLETSTKLKLAEILIIFKNAKSTFTKLNCDSFVTFDYVPGIQTLKKKLHNLKLGLHGKCG